MNERDPRGERVWLGWSANLTPKETIHERYDWIYRPGESSLVKVDILKHVDLHCEII